MIARRVSLDILYFILGTIFYYHWYKFLHFICYFIYFYPLYFIILFQIIIILYLYKKK